MTGPCLCGDTECPSCGAMQGTVVSEEMRRAALAEALAAMPHEFQGELACAIQYAHAVYRLRAESSRGRRDAGVVAHWEFRAEKMARLALDCGVTVSDARAPAILGDFRVIL